MKKLPNKKDLINNFKICWNNEEKLMYLIDLGKKLPLNNENIRYKKNFIYECQSKIWIKIKKKKNILIINGDSNTLITKGFLAITIIAYKNINIKKINSKIYNFLNKINLLQQFTLNKLINLKSILLYTKKKITNLQKKSNKKLIIQ